MNLAVLGAGAWGTALAIRLSARHRVELWGRDCEALRILRETRLNSRYLPDYVIPESVRLEPILARALKHCAVALLAVPAAALRETVTAVGSHSRPIVWACKGLEPGSAKPPYEVVAEGCAGGSRIGVLSGPSFAPEVAAGKPAALTLASQDEEFAEEMARQLHGNGLRVYSSTDVIGVCVGGALKNVMAIAAGMCDGMELGHNARAALITRGLAEIARLGAKLGGRPETFMGLAGVGDLVLTCTGELSRNRRVGLELARGDALPSILSRLGHVAEGVLTAQEALRLAGLHGTDMPITEAVCSVLYRGVAPAAALQTLLARDPKPEAHG
jgi:glycerol-3-phosphate dehydrogenase (NAD(P)+)